jgi:hypothetical protein
LISIEGGAFGDYQIIRFGCVRYGSGSEQAHQEIADGVHSNSALDTLVTHRFVCPDFEEEIVRKKSAGEYT